MIADVRLCDAANVILAKAATFVNGGGAVVPVKGK